MAEISDNQVLDREVWTKLPLHLLERVLSMIPLHFLVALRVVCKRWNVVVIPSAGRLRKKHSPSSAALVFSIREEFEFDEDKGVDIRPIWIDVDDRKLNTGQCRNLPTVGSPWPVGIGEVLKSHRDPSLFASEGGLFFFKLLPPTKTPKKRRNEEYMEPDVLVCNPLTGHYKILCPPSPDRSLCRHSYDEFLEPRLGVHFRTENESYKLVVARFHCRGIYSYTMVYDSLTCSWSHNVTLTGLLEYQGDIVNDLSGPTRGICHEGNLYWMVEVYTKEHLKRGISQGLAILKYNLENDVMSRSKLHVHYPWPHDYCLFQTVSDSGEVLFDDVKYSTLRKVKEFERGADIKLAILSPDILPKVHNFVAECVLPGYRKQARREVPRTEIPFDYVGFRRNEKFYYIIGPLADANTHWLQILVHDTSNNSIRDIVFPQITRRSEDFYFLVCEFWAFSPSLTTSV